MQEITDNLLIQLAGKAAFGRGLDYYQKNRVGELQYKGKKIYAQVQGTENYEVRLTHTSKQFEGSCDCPASDDFDFCKHCVATALKYRDSLQQQGQLRQSTAKDRLPAYLMTLDKQSLVDLLLQQLENDRATRAQLTIRADQAAGKLSHNNLKKQISAATPLNKHLFKYTQVRKYFDGLESVLDSLAPIIPDLPTDKALALVDYAFERIDRALETIDDSGGFRLDALTLLGELHQKTLAVADWPDEQRADYLYALFNRPEYDFYPNIPDSYRDILGDSGLNLFLQKAQADLEQLPPMQGYDWDLKLRYLHLSGPLEERAEQTGDGTTLIDLRGKTATDFFDFLRLSGLCLQYNLIDQAQSWRQRAEDCKDKPYNAWQYLDDNQQAIYLYQNNYPAALELRWNRFAQQPQVNLYQAILEIPGQSDDSENRNKALELAQQAINQIKEGLNADYRQQQATDSLAELYLLFGQNADALTLAETHKLRPDLLIDIAKANPEHPARGLPLIYRSALFYLQSSNNDSYRQAIACLKTAHKLADEQHLDKFRRDLHQLLKEYKRKRNFYQWAREAFADILPEG